MKLASSVARASYAPVSTRTAAAAPAAIPSRRAVGAALLAVVPSVMLSAAQPGASSILILLFFFFVFLSLCCFFPRQLRSATDESAKSAFSRASVGTILRPKKAAPCTLQFQLLWPVVRSKQREEIGHAPVASSSAILFRFQTRQRGALHALSTGHLEES